MSLRSKVLAALAVVFLATGVVPVLYQTFLLLANPGNDDAHVTVTYLRDSGGPITVEKVVPPLGRITTNLAFESPELLNAAIATRVVSDRPIVSERTPASSSPASITTPARPATAVRTCRRAQAAC